MANKVGDPTGSGLSARERGGGEGCVDLQRGRCLQDRRLSSNPQIRPSCKIIDHHEQFVAPHSISFDLTGTP